jgi:hypothetical protein
MYEQSGQSFVRGVTFCLCPEEEGVCLMQPITEPVFMTNDMEGADIDQDGWRDLVFTVPLTTTIGVYMGGVGGFTLSQPISVPEQCTLLGSGDFDQDGDVDIVAATLGSEDVYVVLNGGGTLAYTSTVATGQPVIDIRVADFDGQDGPDMAVAMNAPPYLVVLLNSGNATFAASNPATVANPYRLAVGDADGDGMQDLLIGRSVQDSIYLLHGNGNGTFAAPDGNVSGVTGPAVVGIGDFTFDGINDLVTCDGSSAWAVRPGTGGGNFGATITGQCGPVNEFIIAPFPQDTLLRMLVANYGSTQRVDFSSCSNTYPNVSLVSTAAGNHLVDVADWTNDGSLDILGYYTGGEVRLWRNCDTTGIGVLIPDHITFGGIDLLAYPTPTDGNVTLVRPAGAAGPAEVMISTLRGECLRRFNSSAPLESVDLLGLVSGIYLIHYRTATAQWTTRLVLARN